MLYMSCEELSLEMADSDGADGSRRGSCLHPSLRLSTTAAQIARNLTGRRSKLRVLLHKGFFLLQYADVVVVLAVWDQAEWPEKAKM